MAERDEHREASDGRAYVPNVKNPKDFEAKFKASQTAWLKTASEPGRFKMKVLESKKDDDGRWVYKLENSDGNAYNAGAWVAETDLNRAQGS